MSTLKRNIDIVLILVVGFVLRFVSSFIHSYSNDELSAITRLRFTNFTDLIHQGVQTGDMHPAGVQLFMKGWSLIGGTSEVFMRFPFVLFGTASIWVLFLIGKNWFNRKTGLFAAGILAVLYFPILNSEFARPYSPGLLLCLLTGLFLHKVLFQEHHKFKNACFLSIFFALAMYTHYFAFLLVGFMGLSGLLFVNRTNWKPLFLSGMLGLIMFLPHISITTYHMSVGGLQWLAPPTYDWLFLFIFHAFNSSLVITITIILFVLAGLFSNTKETINRQNLALILIWFFGIFIVGFILSYVATPVLKYPVMLFAFPFFLLFLGIFVSRIKYFKLALIVLMAFILASTIFENKLFGNRHYALFKEVAVEILDWEEEYGPGNIYTIYNLNNPSYMNYYANQWGDTIHFDWDLLEFDSDITLRSDLMKRDESYCILGFSSRLTLLQVFETVKEFYPVVVDSTLYNNGSVYLFKKGQQREGEGKIIGALNLTESSENWNLNGDNIREDSLGHSYYLLDETTIYGPEFVFDLETIPVDPGNYLKVEVVAALPPSNAGLTVAFSAERDNVILQHLGENFWMGHDLENMINTREDKMGYFAFEIPAFIQSKDALKISLWNRSGLPTKIYSIRIIEKVNHWN